MIEKNDFQDIASVFLGMGIGDDHVSVYVSGIAPTTKNFIPCDDGVGHNELENTSPEFSVLANPSESIFATFRAWHSADAWMFHASRTAVHDVLVGLVRRAEMATAPWLQTAGKCSRWRQFKDGTEIENLGQMAA